MSSAAAGGRVLVVDDKAASRQTLCQYVRLLGHATREADNGRAALDLLRAEPFDLVLLDVVMPQVDGYLVLEQLKADPGLCEIPVIMVSGLDEVESVVRCIERGAEDFLSKPYDPVLLRARINASLEKKRLRDAEQRRARELEQTLQQLKAAQEQLLVREKMASLGELTAGIAHEIRNPLTFVTGFAQQAAEYVADLRGLLAGAADEVRTILSDLALSVAKVGEHGERANHIVAGMLLHARGESGRRRLTDLNALVAEAVHLAYQGCRGREALVPVEVETVVDHTLTPVDVYPQDLSRVVVNLTQNALYAVRERKWAAGPDYTPRVTVRTRDLGGEVELRVRDNGTGIAPAVRERLFQPFFTTKPAGSGTGLGLSISHDIVVQLHRGRLQVESEEGSFAEFIVTLPKHAGEGAEAAGT
jgi:signal transduction histidine kinase